MKRWHRRSLIGTLIGAGVILLAALHFGPALLLALTLAGPSVEAWVPRLVQDPVREELRLAVSDRWIDADLYRPSRTRRALVLVHGLSRDGRRHPQLVRLARLLAREGELVLVPEIEGLAAFRLGGNEVGDIRAAVDHLAVHNRHVGIAGFSFGAGPALIAAADLPGVSPVGSFGGYADLRNVIRYITTGVHTFRGARYEQRPEEYNRWKLLAMLTGFIDDAGDRPKLEAIARAKLADPSQAVAVPERDLGVEGRTVLAVVRNRREEAVHALLENLPPRVRAALDHLSPGAVLDRLGRRLLIAHGAVDDSIPFTEALRLASAARAPLRVVIFRTMNHTGRQAFWPSLHDRLADAWGLFLLAADLLGRPEPDPAPGS